jgi:hypothetical protein
MDVEGFWILFFEEYVIQRSVGVLKKLELAQMMALGTVKQVPVK